MFHLELYHIHSVPVVTTMLPKTLTIHVNNSYLDITDNEQDYTSSLDMDIMKCLVSKGHNCCLSGGFYPEQGSTNSALA